MSRTDKQQPETVEAPPAPAPRFRVRAVPEHETQRAYVETDRRALKLQIPPDIREWAKVHGRDLQCELNDSFAIEAARNKGWETVIWLDGRPVQIHEYVVMERPKHIGEEIEAARKRRTEKQPERKLQQDVKQIEAAGGGAAHVFVKADDAKEVGDLGF